MVLAVIEGQIKTLGVNLSRPRLSNLFNVSCFEPPMYSEIRRGAIQLTSGWNGVIWSLPYMRHSKRGNFIGLDGGVRTLSSSEMIKSYSLAGRYSDGNHYAIKIALCVK